MHLLRIVPCFCLIATMSRLLPPEGVANGQDGADPVYAGKPLSAWRADLKGTDRTKQEIAIKAVEGLGPKAVPALPDLLEIPLAGGPDTSYAIKAMGKAAVPGLTSNLKAGGKSTPDRALFGLRRLGPAGVDAVPALVGTLDHTSPGVRTLAANALRVMGPGAKAAAPKLKERMADPDAAVRGTAALALAAIDPTSDQPIPVLINSLLDPNRPVAFTDKELQAALVGYGGRAVPHIVKSLKGTPGYKSGLLVIVLSELGPAAAPAVPDLVAIMLNKSRNDGGFIPNTLRAIGPAAKTAVPELIKQLEANRLNAEWGLDQYALMTIGGIGSEAKAAVPVCLRILNTTSLSDSVRSEAANALGRIGGDAKAEIVPRLKELFKSSSGQVRDGVVAGLVRLDPAYQEIYPYLVDRPAQPFALTSDTLPGRMWPPLREAGKSAIPGLRPFLSGSDATRKLSAAKLIAGLDPTDQDAIRVLLENAAREWPNFPRSKPGERFVDPMVIAEIKAMGAGGAPHLIKLLKHQDKQVRQFTAVALSELGTSASEAVPALRAALPKETYPEAQAMMLLALREIGPKAKPALAEVRAGLKAPDAFSRYAAAAAIAELDPEDKSSIPVLMELLKPENLAQIPDRQPKMYRVGTLEPEPPGPRYQVPALIYRVDHEAAVRAGVSASPGFMFGKKG
jgi:HEAT repeat protein